MNRIFLFLITNLAILSVFFHHVRIVFTKTGSITSFQAVYVPADDLTDPSPARISQWL